MRKYKLGLDIEKIDRIISRDMDANIIHAVGDKVTVSQAYVIDFMINTDKEDIFQKDLEKQFDLKRAAISLMLNNMEKNDLIKRVPVSEDARLKKLVLTEKSIALANTITTAIDEIEHTLLEDLTQEEIDNFYTVLNKMRNSLSKRKG